MRWCQVQTQGIQSRRAESLGMGVGGKGTRLKGAWDKGGLRGKVPEWAGQEGTALLSFHVTKSSSEERGNNNRLFFFFFSIIRYKTLSVNFSILGLLNNI